LQTTVTKTVVRWRQTLSSGVVDSVEV